MNNRLTTISFLLCLFISTSAHSALIDMVNFVRDDVAMVDYLKLSQTTGFSWVQIVDDDDAGFIGDGWGVTSQTALVALDTSNPMAYPLINNSASSIVITNNDANGGQSALPSTVFIDIWSAAGSYAPEFSFGSTDSFSDELAISLSRAVTPVPLPAAAWLFGSALLSLVAVKRKKV